MELKSTDLTAQILVGEQLDAMCEILDACDGLASTVTLLKGISIFDQYYPKPHLRPMRDLDLLVDETTRLGVEAVLSRLGYRQRSKDPAEAYETHHHSMPFFHPQRGIWVEVHRGLFPPKSRAGMAKVFSIEHVKTQQRPSVFHGRTVTRLSDELQIIYIAAHWGSSFHVIGGMVAMLDMIYLLQQRKGAIDWEQILRWVYGSVASIYLYLMFTYLHKYGLLNSDLEIPRELRLHRQSYRSINVKILHALIDRYVVDGCSFAWPWSLRNIRILWQSLLLPGSPLLQLMLVPYYLLLPWRIRKRFPI
jgi:hypothetical protein